MNIEHAEVKMNGTTAHLFLKGVEVAMVNTLVHPLETKPAPAPTPAPKKKAKPAAE